MSSTFLHEEKPVSPDDIGDVPPACERCGTEMWLTTVNKTISDKGIVGSYLYECKNCGAVQKKQVKNATAAA